MLSDEDHFVTESYGLFDLLDDGVSAPATLIVNRDGELVGSHVGATFADRASTASILAFLRERNGTITGTSS